MGSSTRTAQLERDLGIHNYRGSPKDAEAALGRIVAHEDPVFLPLSLMASGQLEFKKGARLDRTFAGVTREHRHRHQQNAIALFRRADQMWANDTSADPYWQATNRWYWFMAALYSPSADFTKAQLRALANAIGTFSVMLQRDAENKLSKPRALL